MLLAVGGEITKARAVSILSTLPQRVAGRPVALAQPESDGSQVAWWGWKWPQIGARMRCRKTMALNLNADNG